MHVSNGVLLLSATDLTDFLACQHLTQLELAVARGERVRPTRDDPSLALASRRGMEHEKRYLAHVKDMGLDVVEIPWAGTSLVALEAAHSATIRALRDGVDVVYQAALLDGRWRGYADFLVRVDRPSELGSFSYEVADAKLSHTARTGALLQMGQYAEQLARTQGREPERVHLILGTGQQSTHRLRDYSAYYRYVKSKFEAVVDGPATSTYPHPVEHCAVCTWASECGQRRRDDDHLSLVAGIRRDQVSRLEAADITTVAGLASSDGAVKKVGTPMLNRLRAQARLQVHQRQTDQVQYELIPPADGTGLNLLPPPSPGDLFFDMEGDPYVENGGLEYLFGVVQVEADGSSFFRSFWAHDRGEEKRAFERFVDIVMDRLEQYPDMHVYHYAPYEPTAVKRLMGVHATREAEVDRLLRGGVFVDLYHVVRQALVLSQESYSIKKLEPLYMAAREDQIKDAGSSIVAYEQWIETQSQAILDEIEAYNEVDCISTWKLRDWLEQRRLELEELGCQLSRPEPGKTDLSEEGAAELAQVEALAARLLDGVPEDAADRTPEQRACWLLAQILSWHRREAKPEWWAFFQRQKLSPDELIEDTDAIGGLRYVGTVGQPAKSVVHRYAFDASQEHKILVGSSPCDPRTGKSAGTVIALDGMRGFVDVKRGVTSQTPHPEALIPSGPVQTKVLSDALLRLGAWVAEHGIDAPGPSRAARDLLLGRSPRVVGHPLGAPLRDEGEEVSAAARRLVLALDDSYLPVQGPPGSGKTFTGAHMVVDLVRRGKRVGITAFSHKAISNLLDAIAERADESQTPLRFLQKAGVNDASAAARVQHTDDNKVVEAALADGTVDVVAGTAWLFARKALSESLDVLFVDEAGQLSLANTLAVAGAAKSLVLLGDPQQLSQPGKGSHPPGAEKSALEHVLGEHATIPAERGLLLDTSWRMHPSICSFVSDVAYDDRLLAHPSCVIQSIEEGEPLGGVGLRYVPLVHAGNRTASTEEAEWIARAVAALLGQAWTDRQGQRRPLTLADILVVVPYNAQVTLLTQSLPSGARVGTVDRFQGQEAPVVLFSTGASSMDDAPRGLEFLFSLNRLNVAISRARGLAALVCAPSLLDARCHTPEQMRLLNAFCRLIEMAEPVPTPDVTVG